MHGWTVYTYTCPVRTCASEYVRACSPVGMPILKRCDGAVLGEESLPSTLSAPFVLRLHLELLLALEPAVCDSRPGSLEKQPTAGPSCT